jgi:hypothetical protein
MSSRRRFVALGLAAAVSACGNVGRNGFYELIPKRQFKIVIEERAHDSLLLAVQEFAEHRAFGMVQESYRSALTAPAIFWILERLEGMIVFQNKIVGQEPDPQDSQRVLYRHSKTEFSAMFYRSVVGYSDEQIENLISLFGHRLSAVEGFLEFVDAFPRNTP